MPDSNTETSTQTVTLYYREGSSDKVYTATIEPKGSGYVVNFAFGRRGTTLQTGTKTNTPVPIEQARKIFDKLVSEKTAKGYTPGEDGTPYLSTTAEERVTGLLPQLLNPIDEADIEQYLSGDAWLAQEKLDGKRTMVRKTGNEVVGANRRGLAIRLSKPIADAVARLKAKDCVLDGEAIGDVLYVFDLLEQDGVSLRAKSYLVRYQALVELLDSVPLDALQLVEAAITAAEKKALHDRLRDAKREGIVFKRKDAHGSVGRPASGGSQVKLKFWATASCLVRKVSAGRRSVELELIDNGKACPVGNVTIPSNHAVPKAGTVVEVRYLYAFKGGSLYQPIYIGVRDDITAAECVVSQLKFKSEDEDDAV